MAYKKTGYENWIDYDEEIDTIKWGDWTFNPEALGLKRSKTAYDPKGWKKIDDVYKALGADEQSINKARYTGIFNQPSRVFFGQDDWKNDIAYELLNVAQGRDPNYRPNMVMGMGGWQDPNGGGFGMGDIARPPAKLFPAKPITRVKKGDDGMIYLEERDPIPNTEAFAQSINDMAWGLYNDGVNQRYGKTVNDKSETTGHGKAPVTGLLA